MPRNRPVDYPQVHPPTVQAYSTLAPPPNIFTEQPRFSWQDTSNEATSPSRAAEKDLEAGISGRRQEHRKSSVPPLPVLPDHLNEPALEDRNYTSSAQEKQDYPSQRDNDSALQVHSAIAQQFYQQQQLPQAKQFRPDIPRHIQQESQIRSQQEPGLESQPLGPPLSYEASQAQVISQQPHYIDHRMQEQPIYPGNHDVASSQLSAHALPIHNDYQRNTTSHAVSEPEYVAQESARVDMPIQSNYSLHPNQEALRGDSRLQASRPVPIHIGPDTNPLTPTSPTMMSPTRHQPIPSPKNKKHKNAATTENDNTSNDPTISFPQATSYTPPGPARGGTWQNSLSSCSAPTICLPSMFCPCIIYGRTQYRLSQKSAKKDPTNMLGYRAVNGSCIAWSVLCGVNILLTAIQHTRVRKMYEMESGSGGVVSDFGKSICCCCCIVAQDEKEVKGREESGREGMAERGYKSPGAMMYSPPPR